MLPPPCSPVAVAHRGRLALCACACRSCWFATCGFNWFVSCTCLLHVRPLGVWPVEGQPSAESLGVKHPKASRVFGPPTHPDRPGGCDLAPCRVRPSCPLSGVGGRSDPGGAHVGTSLGGVCSQLALFVRACRSAGVPPPAVQAGGCWSGSPPYVWGCLPLALSCARAALRASPPLQCRRAAAGLCLRRPAPVTVRTPVPKGRL